VEDDDGKFLAWAEFVGVPTSEFDSTTLLPLGVSVQLDTTDRDVENWAVTGWFCMGQFYSSTEEFHDAVFSGSFEKPAPNVDGNWTSMDRQGERLPLDELPPPAPVSPGSQRFALDVEEKYVTWMDFSFYMSTTKTAGLSLFDIRYKGKRIIYELALQEALAQYAGADPVLAQSSFFDVLDGMGSRMVTLVNGYDCPNYATYLNSTVTILGVSTEIPNSICMFEYDTGYPIRRHLHAAGSTSSAKNIVFSVRTISTVGNYDYLIEYSFFLDGGVEISVRASGYISSAYYAGNEDYGFKIHDFLSGDMHDHVLTFKADLDILGEENSVQKVEFVPDTIE
jgi:primary-amine oxidase